MMKKRLCAAILAVAVVCSLWVQPGSAAETDAANVNQNLLNAILYGERKWVAETLLDDDRSNNPMAKLHKIHGKKSLAQQTLDNYYAIDTEHQTEKAVYRLLVDAMNAGDGLVTDLVDTTGAVVAWAAGLFDDDVAQVVDDLRTSKEEMRYDRMLKGVFETSYTASNGDTLSDTELSLAHLRQVKNTVDYLGALTGYINATLEGSLSKDAVDFLNYEYLNKYSKPYLESCEKFLQATTTLGGHTDTPGALVVSNLTSELMTLCFFSSLSPTDWNGYLEGTYTDLLKEILLDANVTTLLNGAGKTLELTATSLDSYLYLNTLNRMKENAIGPMERAQTMAQTLGCHDLEQSLAFFVQMMGAEYNESILSPESALLFLRNNATTAINKSITKGAQGALGKMATILGPVTTPNVASLTGILSLSSWVTDRALNLSDTCKKTYELLHWKELTDLCVTVCCDDIQKYKSAPSEELAGRVLDDLMLLQRLRLYGEKTAYGIAAEQMTGWVGLALGGGQTTEAFTANYNSSVDSLIAASVSPTFTALKVPAGMEMAVQYDTDKGYTAVMTGEGTGLQYFAELDTRLAAGVILDGTMSFHSAADEVIEFGYLQAGDGSYLGTAAGSLYLNELYHTEGSTSLYTAGDSTIRLGHQLVVNNCTYTSEAGLPLQTKDLTVTGNFTGGCVTATGTVTASETTGAAALSQLHLAGTLPQTIDGFLTVGDLRLYGPEVTIDNSVTVTGVLYSPDTKVNHGERICFSGTAIEGGVFNGALTAQNAIIADTAIRGSLFDKGGTAYSGIVTTAASLSIAGPSSAAEGSSLTASGSAWLGNSGALEGSGTLSVLGDLELAGTSATWPIQIRGDVLLTAPATLDTLTLNGAMAQRLTGSALRIKDLNLFNPAGVYLNCPITVTGRYDSSGGPVTGGTVTGGLSSDQIVTEDTVIHGDLTLSEALTVNNAHLTVEGDLTLSAGDLSLDNGSLTVLGSVKVGSGNLALTNAALTVGGSLWIPSGRTLTLDAASTLTTRGWLCSNGAALTLAGRLNVGSDLVLNASSVTGGHVTLGGDLSGTGTITLDSLTCSGKLPQSLSAALTCSDLTLDNPSSKGITVTKTITYIGTLTAGNTAITGETKLVKGES